MTRILTTLVLLMTSALAQEAVNVGSTTGSPGDSILLPLEIDRTNPVVAAHLVFKYTPAHVEPGPPIVVDGVDHIIDSLDDRQGEIGIILSSPTNAVIPPEAQIQIPIEILSASPTGGPSIELVSITFTEASGTLRTGTSTYPLIEQWRRDNFTASEREDANIVGDDRDPDADQIPNLIELAAGLNPTSPDPTLILGPIYAPPTLSVLFQRSADASLLAAVRLFSESSTDLIDWTETGITETVLSNPEPSIQEIEATITPSEDTLFLRLNAERVE